MSAKFDYHSLNYGRDAHATRAEMAIYRPVAIVTAVAIIADVGRISTVIERTNIVISGERSLIIAIAAIIPINSGISSIPNSTRIFLCILLVRNFICNITKSFIFFISYPI